MMQQLFNGGGRGEERKVFNGGAAEGASSSSNNQNLRCPRCDSTNTKFCYYNNYNLTQPRHFCKTCRRYWTKGGALRNVPVGGGRRKNEGSSVSTAFCKSKMGKAKAGSSDAGKSNLGSGFVHDMPFNPILWGSPQDSHIMSLFRATQNPNPNPNPNPNSVLIKGESTLIGSHMASDSTIVTGSLNTPSLSLDPLNQDTLALSNSLWRNHMHQQQNSTQWGEAPNNGIQQLYQRHRSSTSYYANHSPTMFSSESSSATGGELGYWNSELSWPNVPTTNGAFP